MGVTTNVTTLNYKALIGDSWDKLCDINNYPDMGSTPSKLDNTSLSNPKYKTSQNGLIELSDQVFEANYDEAVLALINSFTTPFYVQLKFGTADGEYTWQGEITAYANGGGVDEIRKMTVSISCMTPPVFATN